MATFNTTFSIVEAIGIGGNLALNKALRAFTIIMM
jgi:hypothetical protein